MTPTPDTDAAIDFLLKWHPSKWVITAIALDRINIATRTFHVKPANGELGIEDMRKFIAEYNGHRNIYFNVNQIIGNVTSKPKLSQVESLDCLWIDIDPREGYEINEERNRAYKLITENRPKGVPEPSVITFSGGGYQAYWLLKKSVNVGGNLEITDDLKAYNQQLESLFSSDHTHNLDRVMRVPGTINLPNEKKKAKGQGIEIAQLIAFNDLRYELDQFMKQPKLQNKNTTSRTTMNIELEGGIPEFDDVSYLDKWDVPVRVKVAIVQGRDPDNPKMHDNSRSSWLFDVVCNLIRCNVPNEVIYAVITNKIFLISESVLEKSDPHKYAMHQINRAHERVVAPELLEMNERHAVIGNFGGACRIIEEVEDQVLNRKRMTISTMTDINTRYMNRKVQIGVDSKGLPLFLALGKWWMQHPNRRQYRRVMFAPGYENKEDYNLWQGFAVQSKEGDWSIFREHLFVNVCRESQEIFDYVMGWMARTVQQPATQGEVAIVMKGGRGIGKSKVAQVFGSLFGRHTLHISNSSHLVGNFNAHLRDTLFLFADEAFFAGDKKHESVLKTLITEETLAIEAKGVDLDVQPNFIHLMMASNNNWVIPAGPDERRYLVLEVGERNKQDYTFFGAMDEQLNNGGREGFLYDLMRHDISDFNVRDVPYTDALADQKKRSLGSVEEWWYSRIREGRILPEHETWIQTVPVPSIYSSFVNYVDKWKIYNRNMNETVFGRDFAQCVDITRKQRIVKMNEVGSDGRTFMESKRVYCYDFPTLEESRAQWEKRYGREKWPRGEEEDAF